MTGKRNGDVLGGSVGKVGKRSRRESLSCTRDGQEPPSTSPLARKLADIAHLSYDKPDGLAAAFEANGLSDMYQHIEDRDGMIERLFAIIGNAKVDHEWMPVLRSQCRNLGITFHDHNAHLLQESDDASQASTKRES